MLFQTNTFKISEGNISILNFKLPKLFTVETRVDNVVK